MNTTLKSHVRCTKCERTRTLIVRDAPIEGAQALRDVAEYLEEQLAIHGWAFAGGEFEAADGCFRYIAGIWCPSCMEAFQAHALETG